MDDRSRLTTCRVGMIAAAAVILIGFVYMAVLSAGFLSLGAPDRPIGDPWFAILELLIVAMMPAMVVLTAAIHVRGYRQRQVFSLASLIFVTHCISLTARNAKLRTTPAFGFSPVSIWICTMARPFASLENSYPTRASA